MWIICFFYIMLGICLSICLFFKLKERYYKYECYIYWYFNVDKGLFYEFDDMLIYWL